MARKAIKLPYMAQNGNVWYAYLRIPADVQHVFGGRSVMKYSPGLTDPLAAYREAKPIIDSWHRKIAIARGKEDARPAVLIEQARQEFLKMKQGLIPGDEWEDVMHPLLIKLGFSGPESEFEDYRTDIYAPAPLNPKETAIIQQVTGERTAFGQYVAEWHRGLSHITPRSRAQYIMDVQQFGAFAGPDATLQDTDGLTRTAQQWVDKQTQEAVTSKTIMRKLSACGSYWTWLVSLGYAADNVTSPFKGRRIPVAKRKDQASVRQPFTPSQVMQLFRAAQAEQDHAALADLIMLAAYTGARIEELAKLEVSVIDLEAGCMTLSSKTDAGHRTVPIMPQIAPIVTRLAAQAQASRWLFHDPGNHQYGVRSASLSKQFGRLKTRLGFDDRFVFHSIRKTVATLFETAQCPEGIAADILGHEKPTMTYGLYSGGSSLAVRRKWMLKALVYPA